MRKTKRLQNIIAENRYALPVTAVLSALILLFSLRPWQQLWQTSGLLAVSTLLMVELNNANALIRIYSRMVSCSFLAIMTMASFLHIDSAILIVQLCTIFFYLSIFHAYQDKEATGWVFYAFLAIGIGSLFFVHILYFVPVLWLLLLFNINALSIRTFCASLFGLILPYWFVGGYAVYIGRSGELLSHFRPLALFGPPFDFQALSQHQLLTACFVLVLLLMGSIHFIRNSYHDKIRIRMIYETFITMGMSTLLFIVLQPVRFDFLLSIFIVSTAPLIGHFIALTHTRLTNITFIWIVVTTILLMVYNIWIPLLTFL